MKTSTRIICIFLAALMLLTTFGMLFSQLAFAANTDSKSDTSSSKSSSDSSSSSSSSKDDDDGFTSSGSLRLVNTPKFFKVDSHGDVVDKDGDPARSVKKGYVYKVEMTIIDPNVVYDNIDGSIGDYNIYVVSTGGNFSTINTDDFDSDAKILAQGNKGGSPELTIEFYVKSNGKGRNMNLEIGYTYNKVPVDGATKGGSSQSQGTINVRVGEAVLDDDANDTDEDSYLLATPNIIVTSYNYGGRDVMAGNDFPLTINFANTSKDFSLENIIMDVTTSTDLSISNGSNSAYIEILSKGESQTKTLQITASSSIEPKPQQVTVKFSYEYILDKTRKTGERTEVLAIPIVQLDRFSVGELSVPDQIWPGDNAYISIDYVNKGKSEIPNLSARLESDAPGISDSQVVGNVKPGDSGTIDFTVTVNEPGDISGKIIVTYEDAKGNEKSVERPFSTTVMDMGGMMPGEEPTDVPQPMPEDKPNTATIVMAVVGGLMIAGLTGTVIVKKVKLKREDEQDEDI